MLIALLLNICDKFLNKGICYVDYLFLFSLKIKNQIKQRRQEKIFDSKGYSFLKIPQDLNFFIKHRRRSSLVLKNYYFQSLTHEK